MGRLGIFFDMGGVLVTSTGRHHQRQWEQRLGLKEDELTESLTAAIGPGWEGGMTEADILQSLADRVGIEARFAEELVLDLGRDHALEPTLSAWIDRWRSAQVGIGIISNNGPHARRSWSSLRLDDLVDLVVISAEEQIAKPDPRIYRLAADRLGAEVEDCVFVDDTPSCVLGATDVGMAGILHVDPAATVRQLDEWLSRAT